MTGKDSDQAGENKGSNTLPDTEPGHCVTVGETPDPDRFRTFLEHAEGFDGEAADKAFYEAMRKILPARKKPGR